MAIQIPNPGTGNGASGDNEFVLWSKVKDNFSDQTNAASKLVGTANGQIPLSDNVAALALSYPPTYISLAQSPQYDLDTIELGRVWIASTAANFPSQFTNAYVVTHNAYISGARRQIAYEYSGSRIATRSVIANGSVWTDWSYIYSTTNTKLDTNGAITPSSPTIDLYSDRIETNADGARMNPEFIRNGVGDYTIKNTTGLRDEGWYIKIPNDMNGNPKVAVTVDTDKDGNLSVKTYRRIFSMETFIFIPDLETPLDIPDGRWIDLRFNDLPLDDLDDTQTEV